MASSPTSPQDEQEQMLLVAWGEHDSRNTGGAGSASSINLSPIRVFQEEAGDGGEESDPRSSQAVHDVACGFDHTLISMASSEGAAPELYVWGKNSQGQLGIEKS